ncbi:hypothetical protein OS493_003685 [Desmophyllum pertusum]|uniref:Uncharacterized protein n=1 Tax=Desmophyllum pertusum TaxID=174260 RepID=A0A9X0A6H1_9CNID|nr:hypothetical protein OS493_003685 [Desmophyllum pertusum]
MWMQDMLYLRQYGKDLSLIEHDPKIDLVKDTGLTADTKDIKTWLWVAYGMSTVKNIYKHPNFRPRVGCNCVDDIHRILSMAREVDFDKVKEQWYYLLGETYGTEKADEVKDSSYWKGKFTPIISLGLKFVFMYFSAKSILSWQR